MSTSNSTFGSGTGSKNAHANTATVPNTTNTMDTVYTKSVNVNKVIFDGSESSFYLWTTQILVSTET
jgi:hypothetical protein